MTRRWSAILIPSLVPWAFSCILSIGWFRATGGSEAARQMFRDLLLTPNVLIPLAMTLSCIVIFGCCARSSFLSAGQNWAVGGIIALASLITIGVLGFAWGGAYVFYYMLVWWVLSGYVFFVWIAGASGWRLFLAHSTT
ncbi:hypothetical protein HCA58_22975 [Micromonospora sp. HNM0581]|uniref:hypothetical protein n=1 Tax=Micromonospora sp. HNM0581 TaxID=2716341 RepID=UPI00146A7874|nr:hypothetical protein [Micromonospora sp. HNM0581]NLU81151.1 hypothetical protein [Micromonospora sp. HNM0581]